MRGRGRWSESFTDADYIARWKARCVIDDSGCWLWQGFTHKLGYGEASYRGKQWRIHRIMHKLHNPNFDPKLDVCHSCDTPNCCNPDHLWQGTEKDNMIDCSRKKRIFLQSKTQCPKGHPYNEQNTYLRGNEHGHRMRNCKVCCRIRQRIKAGWTKEQAESMPPTPHGHRPVNGSFKRNAHEVSGER